jgi:RNA polymerase sigma-70 factor (ECF subfamily)
MSGPAVPGHAGQFFSGNPDGKQKNAGGRRGTVHAESSEPDHRPAAEQSVPDGIRLVRFRELILPHLDAAYNFARYLTRDPAAADDIVQDAFLRAYRHFGSFAGGDARAWILQITRNCFLTWAKSKHVLRAVPLEGEPADETGTVYNLAGIPAGIDQNTPETELMRRADIERVRALIEEMPQPFKEVLVLREFEDLSYQQIAELTAAPVGTVMSRLARARQLFAKAWLANAEGERR